MTMSDHVPHIPPPPDDASRSGGELPQRLMAKLKMEVEGYDLLNPIGAGGQATVYRARRLKDGVIVAIKILHAGPHADEQARARLKRETQALVALRHPNIVRPIAAGRTRSGLECLVMEYIEGRPLDALWEDEEFAAAVASNPPPPPAARLRLFKQICETVQAAHRKGITHRDLSPSNILIDKHGQPHILDFGMASTAFDHVLSKGREITVTGQFIGKIKYASPEQARGTGSTGSPNGSVDIRSDVYALGVMLYQLLTNGAFPYEVVGNVIDVLNNIIHSKPRRPSEVLGGAGVLPAVSMAVEAAARTTPRAEDSAIRTATPKSPAKARTTVPASRSSPSIVPSEPESSRPVRRNPPLVNETIEAIVLKALEKDPERRYQSAGELAADIDHYLAGRPTSAGAWSRSAASLSSLPSLARWRKPSVVIASTALSFLLIGVIAMNFRTIIAWIGLSAAASTPLATPAASAQQEGSDRRLNALAADLARVDARIRAVNTRLTEATSRKPPELEARSGAKGVLSAADFCSALAKSAGETGREITFDVLDKDDLAREEQAETARIDRETDQGVLLKRRAELDTEQAALWARLAWGTFSGREPDKLYRFRLKTQPNADAATTARNRIIEAGVKVRRLAALAMDAGATALRSSADGGEDAAPDIAGTLTAVADQLRAALADFKKAAGAALDGGDIQGEEAKALADLCKLADSLRDALEGCAESQGNAAKAGDEQARFAARGRVQQDLRDASAAAATLVS